MDSADLTPSSFRSSRKALDANWGPLSEIILSGSPKRLYRFSNNNLAVCSEVIVLLHGTRIIPFESPWSTTTRIESYPSACGRSVIKSIEQFANSLVDVAPSVGIYAGFDGVRSILNCWQIPHPCT